MVQNYDEFCEELLEVGFSMAGGNAKGIYAVVPFDWKANDLYDTSVKWHTGEAETDPWEWRMRVLEERDDMAYAKVFFQASGFITKEWYPYFYAVRRQGESIEEAYEEGTISQTAKKIYDIISQGEIALHDVKRVGGFRKEDNSKFDRAVVELQMRMYITMCGRMEKRNKYGEVYGWSGTVFTTVEDFWEKRGLDLPDLDSKSSYEKICEQIKKVNPEAMQKKIDKFIWG